jgi:hypothetical protein
MTKKISFNYSRHHKIALIDHLTELSSINKQIDFEPDAKKKNKLKISQAGHIKAIKNLTPFLNSIGKISDREMIGILSLDLINIKDLKLKFRVV